MALKAPPLRFSKTFNINNYIQESQYIETYGNQRLYGTLTETGEINLGDEKVIGTSTTTAEPIILNITAPANLQNNNLTSKSYVDYRAINPSVEPTVATLTDNANLQARQLVSKTYADFRVLNPTSNPTVTSVTDASQLTTNSLVSKSYVDSQVSSIQTQFPQIYDFGKTMTVNGSTITLPTITSASVYINFVDTTKPFQTLYIDVTYHLQRCTPIASGQTLVISEKTGDSSRSSYSLHSIYEVSYYKINGTGANYTDVIIKNVEGDDMTTQLRQAFTNWINFTPVSFGRITARPAIIIGFPHSFTNGSIANNGWVASYGATVKILSGHQNSNPTAGDLTTIRPPLTAYFSI